MKPQPKRAPKKRTSTTGGPAKGGLTGIKLTDLYDNLSLELERAETIAGHLHDRLEELSTGTTNEPELYALSVIAHDLYERHQEVREKAMALHAAAAGGAK